MPVFLYETKSQKEFIKRRCEFLATIKRESPVKQGKQYAS